MSDNSQPGHGRPWWLPWAAAAIVAAVIIGIGSLFVYGLGKPPASMPMGTTGGPAVPAVTGYYAGQEIRFLHTEASDAQVATMLTDMMGSPVLQVPALAGVPRDTLGTVYVFTNGVAPDGARGPFGFQPDVFDSAPGDAGYSPLRAVHLVAWRNEASPRVLRSADDVTAARAAGEIDIDLPGVVVNMPMLTWPGGHR